MSSFGYFESDLMLLIPMSHRILTRKKPGSYLASPEAIVPTSHLHHPHWRVTFNRYPHVMIPCHTFQIPDLSSNPCQAHYYYIRCENEETEGHELITLPPKIGTGFKTRRCALQHTLFYMEHSSSLA